MKRIFFLLLFSAFVNISFACSCTWTISFCNSHTYYDLSVSSVIIDSFPNGISIKVLKVLNGNETRDTIKIWDLGGPYNMCNDSLTDSRASYLGQVGDTLILALPRIDSLKNTWDVIGDYHTPGFQCKEYKLHVINNTVIGTISGSMYCQYLNNCILSYDYDSFLVDFPIKSMSCESWLTTENITARDYLKVYPNPARDKLVIETYERGTISITTNLGKLIDDIYLEEKYTIISLDNYASGIYFLTFSTESKIFTKKIVVESR